MVNQRHPWSGGCDLVFQAERPGRGVRIHHEDEREESDFLESARGALVGPADRTSGFRGIQTVPLDR